MIWTHFFDLLGKIAGIALTVTAAIYFGPDKGSGQKISPVEFGAFLLAGGFIWFELFRPLSSWLYVRISLRTRLSWHEARQASSLFSPVRDLTTWYPMTEVKSLPENERVPAIMAKIGKLSANYQLRSRDWKSAPLPIRIIRVVIYILIIGCAIGVVANVPPFDQLAAMQAGWFDDGTYSPMLSIIITTLPLGLLLRWIEMQAGVREIHRE